jgi:bla regulator protein blaR1
MIPNNLDDQLVAALCNTLMHSLWQGIILAAIAGLIVIGTRKSSSALRYNLLISALVLFAIAVPATFVGQYLKGGAMTTAHRITYQTTGTDQTATSDLPPQPVPAPGFVAQISTYLQAHSNTIVMVWFLIICARSLQLGVGLYGTYRFKRVRVQTVKGHWPERMRHLAHALGMTQSIALLESGLARTPMVIGHLKPVILVPIGLLTALSPQEVEAILIHELAHIKRRDYLVNMLQSGMEIVFFFNPAVLWISKLIRTERENCCDDLAVAQDQNKVNYIRALVSCEEYKAFVPRYAMAFPGGKNTLLHRVKRMVNNRNHSLNLFEKTMLALCLVGAGLFMTAFSSFHHKPQHIQPASRVQTQSHIQHTPAQHTPRLAPAQRMPTMPAASQHKQASAPQDTNVKPPPSESTTATPSRRGPTIPDPGDTLVNYKNVQDSANAYGDPYATTGYNNRPYRSGYGRYANQQASYKSDEARIKIELIKEGLVSDTNHIHFTINDKEFILNGVEQSPEIFQRYQSRYNPNNGPGWSWTHGTER